MKPNRIYVFKIIVVFIILFVFIKFFSASLIDNLFARGVYTFIFENQVCRIQSSLTLKVERN